MCFCLVYVPSHSHDAQGPGYTIEVGKEGLMSFNYLCLFSLMAVSASFKVASIVDWKLYHFQKKEEIIQH